MTLHFFFLFLIPRVYPAPFNQEHKFVLAFGLEEEGWTVGGTPVKEKKEKKTKVGGVLFFFDEFGGAGMEKGRE